MPRASRLILALGAAAAMACPAADLPAEQQTVGGKPVPVTARSELVFRARSDADVRNRELWYARHRDGVWAAWQKHGVVFDRDTPIVWQPPEGHWKVFIRYEQISGLSDPQPSADTPADVEFIADRSAPVVAVSSPSNGAFLRSGERYPIAWNAADPHLHSTPISIRWTPGGEDQWQTIATGLANSGTYTWTAPSDVMTPGGRIQVLATDRAGNVGTGETGQIVLDALPPSVAIHGPEISATREVTLAISARDSGPAGLARVQLWFSSDDGETWNAGPARDTEPYSSLDWRTPADGRYLLALVGTDRSGNVSPMPRGAAAAQSRLLVDAERPNVVLSSPIGVELAGGGESRSIFKPGDRLTVRYTIGDANPAPDGVTVLFQPAADARWETLGKGLPPNQPFTFAVPDINTTSARIKVQALDRAGNLGEATAGETFRIDNVVRRGPVEVEL